ncbi:MAG: hypothetical protein H0A76_00330 [Candidatus Thiodubiliella endoseptemdiera]|uniref:Uncharacterized protein n=1 Tax=Candidatus Thiodubiliella endoseptemdiera TaxID=2738886 RepID=A0A853EXZ2_9GAMM|nr:hypothetical protein [Candidatus Thiodubiliella endoseptemdiera]
MNLKHNARLFKLLAKKNYQAILAIKNQLSLKDNDGRNYRNGHNKRL